MANHTPSIPNIPPNADVNDPVELKDAVAMITGASSGIGIGVAEMMASHGAHVVLTARREKPMQELADRLSAQYGIKTLVLPCDVSDGQAFVHTVNHAVEQFGQIDVMVNNAGNAVAKPIHESSIDEIDLQIDVNLKGVAYGCHAVVPHMIQRKTGYIFNIGSVCSVRHFPNYASYTAAKFGVLGLSRAVYEEVRPHGVRVMCICPAAVNTAWSTLAGGEDDLPWPMEQRLQPSDIAQVIRDALKLPQRVCLDTLIVWPTCESTA